MKAIIRPSVISGSVEAPQSKSIAIRLLLASLLGKISVTNLELSDDVNAALISIGKLGVSTGGHKFEAGSYPRNDIKLNLGGSGTSLRMLIPILAYLGIEATIDGDSTLRNRPLGVILDWLRSNGMAVSGDRLPLTIKGKMNTDRIEISGSESSQYISGLIYGLLLSGGGKISLVQPVRSSSYIEMTCDVLNSVGARIRFTGNSIDVEPLEKPLEYNGAVPGDFLLASFYALGAAITGGSVSISNLERPEWSRGDSRIAGILASSGPTSLLENGNWIVTACDGTKPFTEDVVDSPDMAVSLAALAAFASGKSTISGVDILSTKESDRIRSIMETLEAFGVSSETNNNSLKLYGTGELHEGKVINWRDHRIAMLGSVLALKSGGIIDGAETVSKSNPRFFDDLLKMGGRLELRS